MYDVIIAGGGIMAISTAYRLAIEGLSTLVIEKSTVGYEASSRNAGGVRQQFRDPRETELAKFSVEIWKGLKDEIGTDLEYTQAGSMRLAMRDDEMEELREAYKRDRRSGLPVELLDPEDTISLMPANPQAFKLASYCPTDGHANPVLTCQAFAEAAKKRGAIVREGEAVTAIEKNGHGFTVRTTKSEFRAKQVVIAAGPWSAKLAEPFISLPLTPRKPEMAETEPLELFLNPFISLGDLKGYGRQTAAGNLHIGVRSIDAAIDEPDSSHTRVEQALTDWAELFPQLTGVKIRRTWSGYTNWTPDLCPIIGEIPNEPGVLICTGFSGHGFALGPAVGVIMADLLQGRPASASIKGLGVERFL